MFFPLVVGVLCLCITKLCPSSSFASIFGEEERVGCFAFLMSYECFVTVNVLYLFLKVLWVGLQFVIVVFLDHTPLLFGQNKLSC